MMYKFVFEFQGGSIILISAPNKQEAINILAKKYAILFHTESFRVIRISVELTDAGEIVEY